MTPLLAPLVGDAPTITIIGLCKNAGKTTAMCRLIEELSGEVLDLGGPGRGAHRCGDRHGEAGNLGARGHVVRHRAGNAPPV